VANKENITQWFGLKLDKERLFEYSKMPIVSRLNWLEEANKFLHSVTDPKIKESWRKQREGKL
jgi:hypothetical protein